MSVKLIYQDVAVGAAEDAAVTNTTAQPFSDVSLLPFGADNAAIATLEHNQWILDGSRDVLDRHSIAFWSLDMSGEDGIFAAPPTLTFSFDKQYSSVGIYLSFDVGGGNYCREVEITWYSGDTVLMSKTFHPDSASYLCAQWVEAYSKVVVQINATNMPRQYAKLSQVLFGIVRTFERDELRNVKITEEIDMISSEVAINTLDFTLDSKQPVAYMFQLKQPIYAYDGDALIGAFYVDDATRHGTQLYDVSCIDAVGVLDEEKIPAAVYSGKDAKELLLELLDGKFTLELDPALETETITGYLPSCTRREALHHVAFALCAVADTSGTDAVRVYRPEADAAATIPKERTYTGGSVETAAITTAVKVTAHTYSQSGSGNDKIEVGGVTYYHTETVTTISNPSVTATDKQNVVEVKDATLVNPSNVARVAQNVYDYYMRRDNHSVKIVMAGERPGDFVTTYTPWDDTVTGHIVQMDITLSGIAAASCTVRGR